MVTLLCNDCRYETDWLFALEHHSKQHLIPVFQKYFNCIDTLTKYKCVKCNFQSCKLVKIQKHTKLQHKDSEPTTTSLIPIINLDDDDITGFNCPHCLFVTTREMKLQQHILRCHSFENTVGKPVENEGNVTHCEFCTYSTNNKRNLKLHMKAAHTPIDETEWAKCSYCPFKTKLKNTLANHIQRKHISDDAKKWIKCEDCNYKTLFKSDLKTHRLWKHTPDDQVNWFRCSYCEFKTKLKASLDKHEKLIHKTGKRPVGPKKAIKCQYCDHKTHRSSMGTHILLKHTPDDQIKWFKCELCEFKTKLKASLKKHENNKHKMIQCAQCSFETNKKSKLIVHIKRDHHAPHDCEKWSKCEYCYYKNKLKNMKPHTLNDFMSTDQIY